MVHFFDADIAKKYGVKRSSRNDRMCTTFCIYNSIICTYFKKNICI